MTVRAILIDPRDNVATVLGEAMPGEPVDVAAGEKRATALRAAQSIPFGHKIALRAMHKGDTVLKYGASIGTASRAIRPGDHVHNHNMESNRGRGDRART